MYTLKEFHSKNKEKTLFLVCNDCLFMYEVLDQPNYMLHALFGCMILPGDHATLELLKNKIQNDGIRKIIFAGHPDCRTLKYLQSDHSKEDMWTGPKRYVRALAAELNTANLSDHDQKKYLEHHHVARQVVNLSQIPYFREKIRHHELEIAGILIDDSDNYTVHETDVKLLGALSFTLN
jgi:carbonic anhydrase